VVDDLHRCRVARTQGKARPERDEMEMMPKSQMLPTESAERRGEGEHEPVNNKGATRERSMRGEPDSVAAWSLVHSRLGPNTIETFPTVILHV
jgi:hypothetical protein